MLSDSKYLHLEVMLIEIIFEKGCVLGAIPRGLSSINILIKRRQTKKVSKKHLLVDVNQLFMIN